MSHYRHRSKKSNASNGASGSKLRSKKRIKVTIEHGHANHLADDFSSTAYWYQKLPTVPFGILPVEERLPLRPTGPGTATPAEPTTDEQRSARAGAAARNDAFQEARRDFLAARAAETHASSAGNVAQAADIRQRYVSGE